MLSRRALSAAGDSRFVPAAICGKVIVFQMFDFPVAATVFCILVAIAFLALWLWYDRRDHQTFESERRKTTFHCIRCDQLYSAVKGTELAKCPRCGHDNTRLKY